MGAGKGYVLGWMSANGHLPLEHISKIDPDHFKRNMPEWAIYKAYSLREAGSLTHAESSYIAEIAQHVAMENKMNVWVDGSLRDADWYTRQFTDVRKKFPEYRIAILSITASTDTIKKRLDLREKTTGRHIPPALSETSQRAMTESVPKLTKLVDFHATIENDGKIPILKSVELLNTEGDWGLIRRLSND